MIGWRRRVAGLRVLPLLAMVLAACSSTTPVQQRPTAPPVAALPTVTPRPAPTLRPTAELAPPAATQPGNSPVRGAPSADEGPVTPSMARLQLGGERYAALGDPNAPITMIEFSDFG